MALLLASISKKMQIRSAKLSQNINLGHVLCIFGSIDDYDYKLLATDYFVCAQVKVKHPVDLHRV